MRRLTRFLFVLLLFFDGCAGASPVEPPEVTLADIRLSDVRLLETELVAVIRIQNMERRAFEIDGGIYRLSINDIDLGRGIADEELTVPGLGSELQEVTFHLANTGMLANLRSIIEGRRLDYRLDGKVYVGRRFGAKQEVQVSRKGSVGLRSLAP